MTKSYYIQIISKHSDRYGNMLLKLMDKYNKNCLADVTLEQAKDFCVEMKYIEN